MPPHARLALLLTTLALLAAPADASVRLLPTPGADVLRVTSTVGQLVHGGGGGRIDGGGGVDTIFGGRVRNLIYGGPGDDILQNGIRWNKIYGGPGNDTITGPATAAGPTGTTAAAATTPSPRARRAARSSTAAPTGTP